MSAITLAPGIHLVARHPRDGRDARRLPGVRSRVASALGLGDFAADSMYPLLADDVVTSPIVLREGALAVPSGAGLGVDVDLDKLRHYAARNAEEGDHTL